MYPTINIFGYPLPTYGLLSLVGILACVLYAFLTNRGGKAGRLPGDDILHIILLAVVGAIIGGKILGTLSSLPTTLPIVLEHWDVYWQDPFSTLAFLAGGIVFYGGAIGGFIAVWLYCRRYKINLRTVLAIMTPIVPLFHTFGRIGCFFGGCCYGIPVSWGVAFTRSEGAPNGVALLPVQLIEAGCNLILFVVLAVLSRKLRRKWLVMPLYVVSYGVIRFVLEFFRGDKIRGVFLLSTSQWISLVLIVIVAIFWFTKWRKEPDVEEPAQPMPPPGVPPYAGPQQPAGQQP